MKLVLKLILAFVFGTAIIFLVFHFGLKQNFVHSLIEAVLLLSIVSMIVSASKYQVKFIQFEKQNLFNFFISHFFAGILISIVWHFIPLMVVSLLSINTNSYQAFHTDSIWLRCFIGLSIYLSITSLNYLLIYYDRYTEKIKNETELKGLITEAELKQLKFQINPHFIFNSLNSIAALTTIDTDKAREMTLKLSDFMRYTLSNNLKQESSFADEINNVHKYLDIEKIRFGDKFEVVENISENSLKIEVPNMVLQPLFENAIKFGVYDSLEKSKIYFDAFVKNEYLNISISNNLESTSTSNKGEGIGLINIRDRLKLKYNDPNLIKIEKDSGRFIVKIFIPITRN